jgi:hypothetical protein
MSAFFEAVHHWQTGKGEMMKVDVYKRMESNDLCSYLVVPAEKPLPEEVANTDWLVHDLNIDFERDGGKHYTLDPDDAFLQIAEKGYAISHLDARTSDGNAH